MPGNSGAYAGIHLKVASRSTTYGFQKGNDVLRNTCFDMLVEAFQATGCIDSKGGDLALIAILAAFIPSRDQASGASGRSGLGWSGLDQPHRYEVKQTERAIRFWSLLVELPRN